jgi:hypothetical protein
MTTDIAVFDREKRVYETHKQELLASAEGKFVLIHGDQIEGVFESRTDAIKHGFERFGHVPIFTKRIERYEKPARFTSLLIRG